MKLPEDWEIFLRAFIDPEVLYNNLYILLKNKKEIMPDRHLIFNVFNYMNPEDVQCVLYGEDPYPRPASAIGVAFWDAEIKAWSDKTNGSSLKNILKALLIDKKLADYNTSIAQCREIVLAENLPPPMEMFKSWLNQGILLINTAMTFTGKQDKKEHFDFWKPFHLALIRALNNRRESPYYILWGNKARRWEESILQTIDDQNKIIRHGHPTFAYQFLNKNELWYSPFTEIRQKIQIKWF